MFLHKIALSVLTLISVDSSSVLASFNEDHVLEKLYVDEPSAGKTADEFPGYGTSNALQFLEELAYALQFYSGLAEPLVTYYARRYNLREEFLQSFSFRVLVSIKSPSALLNEERQRLIENKKEPKLTYKEKKEREQAAKKASKIAAKAKEEEIYYIKLEALPAVEGSKARKEVRKAIQNGDLPHYPSEALKEAISEKYDLTPFQVSDLFNNFRRRKLSCEQRKDHFTDAEILKILYWIKDKTCDLSPSAEQLKELSEIMDVSEQRLKMFFRNEKFRYKTLSNAIAELENKEMRGVGLSDAEALEALKWAKEKAPDLAVSMGQCKELSQSMKISQHRLLNFFSYQKQCFKTADNAIAEREDRKKRKELKKQEKARDENLSKQIFPQELVWHYFDADHFKASEAAKAERLKKKRRLERPVDREQECTHLSSSTNEMSSVEDGLYDLGCSAAIVKKEDAIVEEMLIDKAAISEADLYQDFKTDPIPTNFFLSEEEDENDPEYALLYSVSGSFLSF